MQEIFASSASLAGILNLVNSFYYSTTKTLEIHSENVWAIKNQNGTYCSTYVIKKKGRYKFVNQL